MNMVQTPAVELPGLRKLTPKEQSQRAAAHACMASDGKPGCEKVVWMGVFFDGTNNNMERDRLDRSHSNVAVLFNTYFNSPETGYYRYYIPGLGTPFPEIGENTESDDGKAFAAGGAARIHYAMIQVYNTLHRAVSGDKPLVSAENAHFAVTSVENGLKTTWQLGDSKRKDYFRSVEESLFSALAGKRPKIKLLNISVFGFSRGSAEARAFCNWLIECCSEENGGYTLSGVPIRFQFLGIFDTVASVGLADSSGVASGFLDWADGSMGIPKAIERCVHFAAAHEIRKSFPLSTSRDGKKYPENCTEVVYPGAHCDVGGGYSPGDQGKAAGGRSHLLSQVPLVKMYLESRRSGVPMLSVDELGKVANRQTIKDLQISPELAKRFQEYAEWSKVPSETVENVLFAHMRLYWRWRLRAGKRFEELKSFKAANEQDKEDLTASEKDFQSNLVLARKHIVRQGYVVDFNAAAEAEQDEKLTVPPHVYDFFDEYVHDSHASFRLYGPMTADDRKVAISKIKQKKAAGKKLNRFEVKALALDAISPGKFPVMHDSDIPDLRDMSSWGSNLAVSAITDTRREEGGHIRRRKVFDKS
jgi:hypothetical protein